VLTVDDVFEVVVERFVGGESSFYRLILAFQINYNATQLTDAVSKSVGR